MTQHHDPSQQASARYHACYSDADYKVIQRALIADLYGPSDRPGWEEQLQMRLGQLIPNRLMNAVTDAASEICHWPGFEGSLLRLAQELLIQRVSWTSVQLIADYLHRFEMPGEMGSADLKVTVQVLRYILKAQPVLLEAGASAGDIHSSRGRTAHSLLVAAEQLTRAAQLLLSGEGDLFYITEKITHATDRIASIWQEEPLKRLR